MSKGMALLLCVPLILAACAKHKYGAEWRSVQETCERRGFAEMASRDDFEPESDMNLVRDICSNVVQNLSGEYPDIHPDEIPSNVRQQAFDKAFEDCLSRRFTSVNC